MKKKSLVTLITILLSVSVLLAGCEWSHNGGLNGHDGSYGFVVQISPDGKAVDVKRTDGKEITYAPEEKKRIPGSSIAFLDLKDKEKIPYAVLSKKEGKWKKVMLKEEDWGTRYGKVVENEKELEIMMAKKSAEDMIVTFSPLGHIFGVSTCEVSDGPQSNEESIDFSNARLILKNHCCWKMKRNGDMVCKHRYC